MRVNKKLVVVCLLVVMVLGLWKGCGSIANKELLESITLYELRQDSFEQMYEALGKVVSQKEVRIPIEGLVVEVFVTVGDVINKDDVLLKYHVGDQIKNLKSNISGIVCDLNDQFVSIVHPDGLWIQVSLPSSVVDKVKVNQKVLVKGVDGIVKKIGSVASYSNGENYYDVFIVCDSDFRLFEEVEVVLCVQSWNDVYRVPFKAVVRCKDKDYLIKQSWLRDTYELDIDDVVMVNVIGVDNGFVVVSCEEALYEDVCVFDGISMEFVEKMLEMYV